MKKNKSKCLVCGEELRYFEEAHDVECAFCGKRAKANATCTAGHYVCDSCHREQGVKFIMDYCRSTASTDPIQAITNVMSDDSIFANGPEHHTLFGASLICAYANAGGCDPQGAPLDKNAALDEMMRRSMQLPGGTCGFWGVCGAAASVGQALSILNGSTPLNAGPWAQCQALTSEALGKMASMGGPRCCKRNGFTAVLTGIDHIEADLGVSLDRPENVVCSFFPNNNECLHAACPYFPAAH